MTETQLNLLTTRLIIKPQKYRGIEPSAIKKSRDRVFCNEFFMKNEVEHNMVDSLLTDAIKSQNEVELDLLLMLINHFNITNNYALKLSALLIQPWHHFHDRIASMLEFDNNEKIIGYLYLGALYTCDNLEYESDYRGFNRKCLYALAKIGTEDAISCLKKVSKLDDKIISNYALSIMKEFNLN